MTCSRTGPIGFALAILACGTATARDREVKVTGRVVDRDGKPVAGARVARTWQVIDGNKLDGFASVNAGADGQFTIKVTFNFDPKGRQAGLIDPRRDGERLREKCPALASTRSTALAARVGASGEGRGRRDREVARELIPAGACFAW